jgi:hypothetical protein
MGNHDDVTHDAVVRHQQPARQMLTDTRVDRSPIACQERELYPGPQSHRDFIAHALEDTQALLLGSLRVSRDALRRREARPVGLW